MAQRFVLAKKYTQKYKDILLPCKYCGNTNIVIASDRHFGDNRVYWSVCCSTHACDCTGDYTSVKDAVEAWNKKQQKEKNMEIIDYQKAVAEKTQIAFDNFFAKEMQKTKEEIFNDAFAINFFTEMKNFLTSDAETRAFEERHYSRLLKCGENVLDVLYVEFLESDTDFRDWDDIVDFIIECVDSFE